MARYPDSFIEQIKNKVDLVDLVSTYVHVDRKGRDYWACCPFHNEKTPSFQIKAEQQYYTCFGCGKKGDIFRFLMDHDQMSFAESVEALARRAGLQLPELVDDPEALAKKALREKVYEINRLSARFYYENLFKPVGQPALDYFAKRGFDAKTINKFGLGYSADFSSLPAFLKSKGYDYDSMIKAGVAYRNDRGEVSDFFGRRVTIPIIDAMGKVIGFSARTLDPHPDFAKYKNTGATPVFFKGRNLFGINLYKKFRQGDVRAMVLVEGHLDVVSLFQSGVQNAVASMGTALTSEQCREIKRYADLVYVSFDGDSAGQHATLRGLDMLKAEGLEVKVVQLPDGLDPDDYVKKYGKDGYMALLDKALPLIDYKLLKVEEQFDLKNKDEKIKYAREAIGVLSALDSVEKEIYVKTVEEKSGIKADVLLKQADNPDGNFIEKPKEKRAVKNNTDVVLQAEKFVLSSIIHGKPYVAIDDLPTIRTCLTNDRYVEIMDCFLSKMARGVKMLASDVFEATEDEETQSELLRAIDDVVPMEQEKYYVACIEKIKNNWKNKELGRLTAELINEQNEEQKEKLKTQIKALMNAQPNK